MKALRRLTDLKFDTHLMIDDPLLYAEKFMEAGSDLLTVHAEVMSGPRFDDFYKIVNGRGKQAGLAIKPGTPLPEWARARLDRVSAIVVMTVNPGFSGQTMDMSVMPKLERLCRLVRERGLATDIEIDGGVEPENAREVVRRGGNVLVAGAGVYAKKDPVKAISVLREEAERGARE